MEDLVCDQDNFKIILSLTGASLNFLKWSDGSRRFCLIILRCDCILQQLCRRP